MKPSTDHPARDWTAIHWPDFHDADVSRWIAVLPLAAVEQHGPHLPLGTDIAIAQAYLEAVRAQLPADCPATFLPIQTVGISSEHLAFPGTLTVPPDVALAVWMALGESIARAGLRKLVIVTSHGGNSAIMSACAQELRARHGMRVVTTSWGRLSDAGTLFPAEEIRHGVHGGAIETSIMLARDASAVRRDAIADFRPASFDLEAAHEVLSMQRPAPLAWVAEDLHHSGAAGDATLATADAGAALLKSGAEKFCALLADMDRLPVD